MNSVIKSILRIKGHVWNIFCLKAEFYLLYKMDLVKIVCVLAGVMNFFVPFLG